MTYLFIETKVNLEDATGKEYQYTVKRSGFSSCILVNLSYFKPETIQWAFYELFLLSADTALIQYVHNHKMGKFIFIVSNGPS